MELTAEEIKVIEELRKQKATEKEEKLRECLAYQVRQLEEFSDEEKIQFFDNLYEAARYDYDALRTKGRRKDSDAHIFEYLMTLMLTPKGQSADNFWTHWRELFDLIGIEY